MYAQCSDPSLALLDFIRPRQGIPIRVEEARCEMLRRQYEELLKPWKVPIAHVGHLKRRLAEQHDSQMIDAGECVGIMCAQSIGECITQSTLNTFHSAGMDTGIVSTMRRIDDIINLPKTGYTHVTLYPATATWSLREFYLNTRHNLECITVEDVVVKCVRRENRLDLDLDLYKLFKYRIWDDTIKEALCQCCDSVEVEDLYALDEQATVVKASLVWEDGKINNVNWFRLKRNAMSKVLVGISGVVPPHRFVKTVLRPGEYVWQVEVRCKSLKNFNNTHGVYDATRTTTNRLRDAEACYGIEATKKMIMLSSESCLSNSVTKATIQLLSSILTYSGHVEPFTRFTMRNNKSPLAKIGFEECLEGCRNAGLYKESENFKTVAASIICGMTPKVGTNYNRVLINLDDYCRVAHSKEGGSLYSKHVYIETEDDSMRVTNLIIPHVPLGGNRTINEHEGCQASNDDGLL